VTLNVGCRFQFSFAKFSRKAGEKGRIWRCHFWMVMVIFYGMKDASISIDRAGRIVLPKVVREELAIKPGDTLKVSLQGSSVTLTPDRPKSGLVRKSKALVFSSAGDEILNRDTVERILDEERSRHETATVTGMGRRSRSS
jgi:AbrB family looped-hinge helix DNA binding protein